MEKIAIILAAMLLSPPAAQAQSPANTLNAIKFPDSGVERVIDCHGRDLTVTGDDDTLSISRCVTINVVGNHNHVRAQLLPTSTIAALGNNNHIVFIHAAGFEVQVTSSGSNNEIIPQMDRDSHDISPVKFPLSAH